MNVPLSYVNESIDASQTTSFCSLSVDLLEPLTSDNNIASTSNLGDMESGRTARRPGLLELCSGSATLSYVADFKGFFAVPIDYGRNKFQPRLPTIKMDLADYDSVDICCDLIRSGSIQVVTAAVPCGTASRAREIPIPNGPRPLRTESHPYGIPGLTPAELLRVETANKIYANVHKILLVADSCGCICFVENPRNSLFFCLDEPKHLLDLGWTDVVFQHCRWSKSRPMRAKWTRLRTNTPQLQILSGPCTQGHIHLPWGQSQPGVFDSAGEAQYPVEMCEAIIDTVQSVLSARGFTFNHKRSQSVLIDENPHKRRRTAGGKQPRGTKLPELITEFKKVIKMSRLEAIAQEAKIIKPSSSLFLGHRGDCQTGLSENLSCDLSPDVLETVMDSLTLPTAALKEGENPNDEVTAGIYRTPEEFLEEALKMKHPIDLPGGVPDELLHSLFDLLSFSPEEAVKSRIKSARELLKLVEDNRKLDQAALESVDPLSRKVLMGKRLHTAQTLIEKWNYPDENLVKDTISGFPLTGMMPFTGIFDYIPKLPTATVNTLRSHSDTHNKSMLSRCKSSGSLELDSQFWIQNCKEVEAGWLVGPFYDLEELSKSTQVQNPHLTRRFPLEQTTKVRSIDDFLESNLNSLYGSHDKLVLLDTDSMASLLRLIERLISGSTADIIFSTGQIKRLEIHPEWKGKLKDWKGKTKDLSQAYKQLACSASSRWASCILVWDPIQLKPAAFLQTTLPFGSSASVLHFNRWSRFLWFLGIKEMGLLWTCFFDDFPIITPGSMELSTEAAANVVLKITGWRIAEGEKDQPWSTCFQALGVSFNLDKISMSASTVGNKEGRVEVVLPMIQKFISERFASTKDIESVRGRLQYMEAQVFGRTLKSALSVLKRSRGHGKKFLDNDLPKLQWIIDWLSNSTPRRISPDGNHPPLLLFTDGACEGYLGEGPMTTSCGAVLIDLRDQTALVFGCIINDTLQKEWILDGQGKRQLVTEAELLPVLIAKRLWSDRLLGAKLLVFVDSNPAKFSLVRGTSESQACENIIRCISILDASSTTWSWYSRVPSKSNIADGPSRLRFPEKIGTFRVLRFEAPQPSSLKDGVWS